MIQVIVFGVFDIIHPGHLYFLRQAKKYGDYLTLVVTRDKRVLAEKGRPPVFNEKERLETVKALKTVDKAILGDKIGEWKIIKKLKPDIVCVGHDQNIDFVKRWKLKTIPKTVRIKSWKARKYSSTTIKEYLATL